MIPFTPILTAAAFYWSFVNVSGSASPFDRISTAT